MPLTRRAALLMTGAAVALSACSTAGVSVPAGSTAPESLSPALVAAEINATRKRFGAGPLGYSRTLEGQARTQARLMAAKGVMSHSLGGSLHDRTVAVGYDGATGENLGEGQRTLEAVIGGWLNSPSHRSILLNKRFTEFGLAAATSSKGRPYWAFIAGGPFEAWR
jgi:uncharacterized protein YkwD